MHREYGSWHSPSLGRPMEFLWYGHWGRPVVVFPTSAARFTENEDFGLIDSLRDKIEGGEIQVCCVDSVNNESWHNRGAHPYHRVRRHAAYDHYLRHEMLPYVTHRAQRSDVVVYGASFGAYHAANLAGRYPEVVRKAVLFSGIYEIGRMLDGFWDELAYFHSPAAYIANMHGEWLDRLRSVEWIICTGEHDSLINENRSFSELLWRKGVPHHSEFWPGQFGHDWPWWRGNLRRFVP